MIEYLVFAVIVALAVWLIAIYNLLVRDRNRVAASWSDIDVQLKRRHDLIPKLVEAVRQYAQFEQSMLDGLTELRTQGAKADSPAARGSVESKIGAGIKQLMLLVEAYPELKTNQSFLSLQTNITEVEDHIQYARRFYNGAVRNLNTRIESFPDILIARLFGYQMAEYFQPD